MSQNRVTTGVAIALASVAVFATGTLVGKLTAPRPAQTTPHLYGVTDEWVDCVREAGSTAADLSDPDTLREAVASSLEFDYCTEHLG